jgi:hypothetical protein
MRLVLGALILATAACSSAHRPAGAPVRQAGRPIDAMPIYVTPFYNSKGPIVNVGPFSKDLAASDRDRLLATARAMKGQFSTLPAEAMYVAAIRLYDHGARDEALYWFYAAQYRARLFRAVLDPRTIGGLGAEAFERQHAHAAFHQLVGAFINGYAGCDTERWVRTLEEVAREGQTLPDFARIYPRTGFLPREQWAARNQEVGAGLSQLGEYVRTHREELRAGRAKNGMDERFCS